MKLSFLSRPLAVLLALVLVTLAGRAGWADGEPRLRVVPEQMALHAGILHPDAGEARVLGLVPRARS